MKVANRFVFLFHVIRNFRESASLSKHFVLTVCIVYPSVAILIFLISFSFFYYTLQHHFKNSFQETSLQSSKLQLYMQRFRRRGRLARLTSRDQCTKLSTRTTRKDLHLKKQQTKIYLSSSNLKPAACSGWFSQ